ncbi:carbon-nitrogen hydrolase family protein [Legionella taurinensis]|uniref:Apolipoprotein acyltransferase n=1 Tax=Legionella taurinensis TaxID=70611 RepID=A0A3A5L7Z3_9GAMM|nr:carbon-nitrogen hydrolase family protein [Legionella taurinensis]MDX1836682.1 carbon-nitrogen hydrolase family protein [Legionella taurinensis]PUT42863.1 apolipoprotein acyltransferase [Legionella taurinensis]PUT45418.1 apolipoprotein acyltransferase [Legionella taurinensis]PUT47007.1 apolipoprotein acyltransferase [Legionella taurinensis]PUT49185.1 apolipoprotein acyltransferase [Legionella taurinensis]
MSKVAVVQMRSSASVQDNLQQVEKQLAKARDDEVDLLVLPENFAFMGMKETDKLAIAEQYGEGEIQQAISALAKKYGVWVVAGTIPIKGLHHRVRASSLVFDDHGLCAARYDKIHLFDVRVSSQEAHEESNTVERGDEVVVVDTPAGRLGLSVCYDLRFPELYQQLSMRGAELFTVPSAFTAITGAAHWEVLLRARAIENLCYVLAPNQGGVHENGRHTHGHSLIVEPWGKIVAEQKENPGMVTAEIDLQRLKQLRLQFPCNTHHVLLGIN